MYERSVPKGKEKCPNPKCVGGFVAGNHKSDNPMERLPSMCTTCKGKGYKK